MPKGRPPKYALEKRIADFVDSASDYLFKKNKTDMEKVAIAMEITSFMFLLGALILRIGRI